MNNENNSGYEWKDGGKREVNFDVKMKNEVGLKLLTEADDCIGEVKQCVL
jgi:hypothetical protein